MIAIIGFVIVGALHPAGLTEWSFWVTMAGCLMIQLGTAWQVSR